MKIKDICSRFSSGNFIPAEKIFAEGKYTVYGGNGLRGYADTYNFDGECAIIGRQGAYCGNVKFFSGKGFMTEHAIVAVGNDNAITRFLAYKFALMNLGRYTGQSAQPGLSVEMLSNLTIELPPLDVQKKISSLLGALDDKIALNKKISATLEDMAKTIYLHRFIRRKPNGKLSDIIIEQPKSAIAVGAAKVSGGEFPFFTSGDTILSWSAPLVDGRNIFLNDGGNVGVKFFVGKAAYSTHTYCITAENLADYLYLLLKTFSAAIEKKFFTGTGLKNLRKDLLKALPIYIPTPAERDDFNDTVQPLFDMVAKNFLESRRLAEFRDWLLPLLMNGQATFKGDVDEIDS